MRRIAVLSLVLAAVAAPVLAQPGAAAPPEAAKSPAPTAASASQNADADRALAMAMRQRAEQDARIAAIACQAGDTSKCAPPAAAAGKVPKS